jgi:hypothetical protein
MPLGANASPRITAANQNYGDDNVSHIHYFGEPVYTYSRSYAFATASYEPITVRIDRNVEVIGHPRAPGIESTNEIRDRYSGIKASDRR